MEDKQRAAIVFNRTAVIISSVVGSEINNRTAVIAYGTNGVQWIEDTVANWRDPIVVAYSPPDMGSNITVTNLITVAWNQAMPADTTFEITSTAGTITGTFGYDEVSFTTTFTPDGNLPNETTFTVTVSGKSDAAGDQQQVPTIWSFDTIIPKWYAYMSLVFKAGTP